MTVEPLVVWRWWIVDERTGKRRLTRHHMSERDALERHPGAERAPLERAGHWIDVVLGATPYAAPFARLGKLCSAGITDLRHGFLLDEDWVGRDRFAPLQAPRHAPPLPESVRCYAIAATLGRRDGDLKDRLLGDGLVPLDSALGRHPDPRRSLRLAEDRQWIGYGMNHLDVLGEPEVYAQLRLWLDGVDADLAPALSSRRA